LHSSPGRLRLFFCSRVDHVSVAVLSTAFHQAHALGSVGLCFSGSRLRPHQGQRFEMRQPRCTSTRFVRRRSSRSA